jgi:hypothetical protein
MTVASDAPSLVVVVAALEPGLLWVLLIYSCCRLDTTHIARMFVFAVLA